MAKKSRKRAARYSELSKAKRRRQVARPGPQPQAVSTSETQEVAAASTKKSPPPLKSQTAQKGPKTQPGPRLTILDYKYVKDDLKRIGILAGAGIVIIIILAFVLR
jgi:hypothetical protein